jgi:galactokinase
MSVRAQVLAQYRMQFGEAPAWVARAPGRVNLIGEHTDYNDGFVLPMAIDREVCIALSPRTDGRVLLRSLEFDETVEFALADVAHDSHSWSEYVKGVAWALADSGQHLIGWQGVLSGDVPRGAGLSSSAALELATMRAFAAVSNSPWEPTAAALLSRRVENEWIGVNSGIMDQLVVASAQADHALLIDCRDLQTQAVPLPGDVDVVVLDTNTRRGLVESAYNERRQQCETAAEMLGVPALRDVDLASLTAARDQLDDLTFRRARHVVSENERTLQAVAALRAGDRVRVGQLMNQSHASLRDDFEVTNDALNDITRFAQAHAACFGARMTGAGFGGCAVALVAPEQTESFVRVVTQQYHRATGTEPQLYACRAAAGANLHNLSESVHT